MDRRWNWYWIVPLILAPILFAITQNAIYLWVGFGAGVLLLWLFRHLALPPHLHNAVKLYRRGQLEAALAAATQAINKSPDRWETYHTRSLINFGLSDLAGAEKDARQAVSLKPTVSTGHIALGQALYWQARYEEAQAAYKEAIRHQAREGLNHFYLIMTQYRLGQFEDVAITAPFALKLGINNPSFMLLAYYYLLDSLERLNRPDEAAAALEQLKQHEMGLEPFQDDLASVSGFPALPALRQDVRAIASRLATA
ncbi:MAG: hypothetical protein KDE09_03640 [Anaerolineales bacterium]|nr:hypothetical protein [Anaerolineales bacterium]MCB0026895.1 hypothetical protein [Anaerolineales bacterium]MCB8962278.1 hypothetical protein [Ardenticatenales bacterium]